MQFQKITQDMATILNLRRFLLFLLFVSVISNLIFALWLLLHTDSTRTIVLSPKATEHYIATDDAVSANLLERFSVEAINLVMNVTPATAHYQSELFMQHVAPESYGSFRSHLTNGVAEIERHMASTAFYPEESEIDPKKKVVCLKGERKTMIGKSVTGSERLEVCLTARVRAGRLWVYELKEMKEGQSHD